MVNKNLQQVMSKEWQKVRKSFHYPQLPHPKLVENIPNGMMDMEKLEVKVSEPFIERFEKQGIVPEESLNEVLTHELTHFMKFPGSVLNILRLQKSAQGIADGHKVGELRTAFTEAQTNIFMLNELKHPTTSKMRKTYGLQEGDSFGRLMYGLYQESSKQDFGIELNSEEKSLVDKLKDIEFVNKNQETTNFRSFVQILKDYQPFQQKQDGSGEGKGKGEGQGQGQGKGKLCSDNGLNGFTDNQIKEGLKQFAKECSNPNEYEEVVRQVLNENEEQGNQEKEQKQQSQVIGKRAGSDKGITQLAENFYTALAEKHTIPIRKKPMHKNGSLYPHSHTSFQVGDSITEVDAFSTPGILPGITKKWVRKEGEVYGDNEAVPDSFLIIDNSPSMFILNGSEVVSPSKRTYPHIVGVTAISNAYLLNDSKVAIYSFGSNDHLTNSIKDREAVHRELRRYSSDGGTTFNSKFLEGVLKDSNGEYDISVISDMDISNLDDFIESVLKIPLTHRIHLLYTENNQSAKQLKQSFGNKENVAILPLTCENDISKITIGELKNSIK